MKRYDRAIIHAISFFPDAYAIRTQYMLHGRGFHLLYRADFGNPHIAEQGVRFLAHLGDFADRLGSEKRPFCATIYVELTTRLGLSCGYLGHGFIHRQSKTDGKSCLVDDALPQFPCPLPTTKKAIHSCEIEIML